MDFICEETGGHPLIIQFLMNKLFRPDMSTISVNDIAQTAEQFLSTPYLPRWFKSLSTLEREILKFFIAHQDLPEDTLFQIGFTKKETRTFYESAEIIEALNCLHTFGLIDPGQQPGSWRLVAGKIVLRFWDKYYRTHFTNNKLFSMEDTNMSNISKPDLADYACQMRQFFTKFRDDLVKHDQFPRFYGQVSETDQLYRRIEQYNWGSEF